MWGYWFAVLVFLLLFVAVLSITALLSLINIIVEDRFKRIMAHPLTLVDLPNDPLLHIFSYLNYKDLVSCSRVCQTLKPLTEVDGLWKVQYKKTVDEYDILASSDSSDGSESEKSWRSRFIDWYKSYGRYIDCYIPVCKAWKQIDNFVAQNLPMIASSIQGGATEEEINAVEARLNIKFPNSVRLSYRIHNGQSESSPIGILGGVQNYSHRKSERLLPLDDIIKCQQIHINNSHYPNIFVPISFCSFSDVSTFIQCGDADFHTLPQGCVFNFCKGVDDDHDIYHAIYISGDSFQNWFCEYARDLHEGKFCVDHHNILKFYDTSEMIAVTEHVRITVTTAFIPEMSHVNPEPSQILFAYRVTLSMDANAPASAECQLESRSWNIVDDTGHVETVTGPGVIGEYPVIRPGSEWSYISCTHFRTKKGNMNGTYTMRKLHRPDKKFQAIVPRFHMEATNFVTLPKSVTKSWR